MDEHNDEETIEGFSDAEIADQLKPMLDEIDADYEQQFERLLQAFKDKGPPPSDD